MSKPLDGWEIARNEYVRTIKWHLDCERDSIAYMVENLEGWEIAGDDLAKIQDANLDLSRTLENIAAAIRARKQRSI